VKEQGNRDIYIQQLFKRETAGHATQAYNTSLIRYSTFWYQV